MTYDGFISYSHVSDGNLAAAVQSALQTLAKPWYRLRALHVFRDETGLSANPGLWSSIEDALSSSKWFIYFASPRACQSTWVKREIEWWLSNRGASSMLIVLTEGTLQWDDSTGSFDWHTTDAFPQELGSRLTEEPLWVDLSWANHSDQLSLRHAQFRAAILHLASPLHGRTPDELDGDDVRQYRQTRRISRAAVAALLALTTAAVTAAYLAIRRSRESFSRELAVQSFQQLDTDPELSVRLALQAVRSAATDQAEEALRRALNESKVLSTIDAPGEAFSATYSSSGALGLVLSGRDAAIVKFLDQMPIQSVLKHPTLVSAGSFSNDERFVATGAWDGKVRLWNVATGKMLLEWQAVAAVGASSQVGHIEFSPDGALLLTVAADPDDRANVAYVWNVSTGTRVAELKGHAAGIAAAAFAPDGKRVATGSWDDTVRIWDAATGAELARLTGHRGVITSVAFSPDGTRIATGSEDLTVRYWDAAARAVKAVSGSARLNSEGPSKKFVAVSRSTRRAFIADATKATIYDTETGRPVHDVTEFPLSCAKVQFSSDDRFLACAGDDGRAVVWDVDTGATTAVLSGHRGEIEDVSFSPDAQVLVTAGTDATVRAWDLKPTTHTVVLGGHQGSVTNATWSPDGRLIATGGDGVRVWDARTGRLVAVVDTRAERGPQAVYLAKEDVFSIAFSADSRRLLVVSRGTGGAHIWDSRTGRTMALNTSELEPEFSLRDTQSGWSADDQMVFVAAAQDPVLLRIRHELPDLPPIDTSKPVPGSTVLGNLPLPGDPPLRGDLLRWDSASGQIAPPISAGTVKSPSRSVMCGSSRKTDIVCERTDQENVSRIWNVRSGVMLTELKGHLPNVFLGTMSDDGRLLALSDQQQVEIWDTRAGRLQSRIAARSNYTITDMSFEPSGRSLVTAGGQAEPVARVWDTASGRLINELRGHTHSISTARFSPDGRLIATGSQDGTAAVWRSLDGRQLMVLRGHQGMLFDAAFSPDGQRVLTASADRTARIFDVSVAKTLPELVQIAQRRFVRELTAEEARRFLH
jgi:WD40 repeat protein